MSTIPAKPTPPPNQRRVTEAALDRAATTLIRHVHTMDHVGKRNFWRGLDSRSPVELARALTDAEQRRGITASASTQQAVAALAYTDEHANTTAHRFRRALRRVDPLARRAEVARAQMQTTHLPETERDRQQRVVDGFLSSTRQHLRAGGVDTR